MGETQAQVTKRKRGRPKGSPNKSNAVRTKKAAETGALPADILLDVARYHHNRALRIRAQSAELLTLEPAKSSKAKQEFANQLNGMEIEIRSEHAMAVTAADKVAPYYHSKLATLQTQKAQDGRTLLEDLVMASMALPPPANENAQLPAPIEDVEEKIDAAE